jgi:hypothetical protein
LPDAERVAVMLLVMAELIPAGSPRDRGSSNCAARDGEALCGEPLAPSACAAAPRLTASPHVVRTCRHEDCF